MDVSQLGSVALGAAVAGPWLAAAATAVVPRQIRAGLWWATAAAALTTVVSVVAGGPAAVLIGTDDSRPALGVIANSLTMWLLLLVCSVGALVHAYAGRYLRDDPRAPRFEAAMAVTVGAMALVATSATVASLIIAWVIAGIGFTAVAGYRRDLPGVPRLVRSIRWALLAGDTALITAAVILAVTVGNVAIAPEALQQAATDLGALAPVVAMLIAVAVLARCAQGMFRGWLRLTVSAPTPVCAILHAGVVSGGGILLVRMGPMATWTPALVVVAVVATATAAWASLVVARQPDVKGQLASSTSAQMGFMLMQCCVGAYPSAMVHLFGHGLYKAALFLSAGSAVPRPGMPSVPKVARTRGRYAAALVSGIAATAAAAPGLTHGEEPVLVVFAAVTAAVLAGAWWLRRPTTNTRRWVWPAGLVVAATCYGVAVAALGGVIAQTAPSTNTGLPVWALLAIAGLTFTLTAAAARSPMASRLRAQMSDSAAAPAGWDDVPRRELATQSIRSS
ncbi:proton-conducting transporter membrane subunit [Hoyosella sp. YIM 151337]|uniref:proton-conducting transporter transmembrane domain-containing protein n=1 Tax=Hoyosella sp. YIM 151337 TaxID=2992742 RepID=UPI002235B2EA|nr:proton-conducting transporter membrane subunit [Hoyosella sp. YIM 151337]MCW4356085.1 proton-conducting transporter membrane subunit [Hoyosella sp. YIM 151337]